MTYIVRSVAHDVIRVSKAEDVPKGRHFAVIVYKSSSHYVEGDERSRQHPGHGYPAHYETIESFEHWVTTNQEVWENFVKSLNFKGEKNFVFFEVPALAELQVTVQVKVKT